MIKQHYRLWMMLIILLLSALACSLSGGDEKDEDKKEPTLVGASTLPTVQISSPPNNSEVIVNTNVLIYSIARDAEGVTKVELIKDGAVIDTVTSPDTDGQTELAVLQSWTPTLVGDQVLQVVAYRGDVRGDPASVTVRVRQTAAQVQTGVPSPTFMVFVPSTDTTCRARINVSALNVREQPNLNAKILTTVSIGEAIAILGRTGGNEWWEINVRSVRGWISAPYTTALGNCLNVPVTGQIAQAPTNTPTATFTASFTPSATFDARVCRARISVDNTFARANPSASAAALNTLRSGTEWLIFQHTIDSTWWQISVGGVLSWIPSGSFTVLGECANVLITTPSPPPNRNPIITPIPAQNLLTNQNLDVNIIASDPDGDSLTMSVFSADPSILSANLQTGFAVRLGGLKAGLVTVTVTVNDGRGGTASMTFPVLVTDPAIQNKPPQITPLPNLSMAVGTSQNVPLTISDPEGRTPIVSVSVVDPTIVQAALNGISSLTITGLKAGNTIVTVRAEDTQGGTASVAFIVQVYTPTATPTITLTLAPSTATATATFTNVPPTGTFTVVPATQTFTPVPPTLTETATATDTPTDTPTGTQVPTDTPTETLTPTLTETATATDTPTDTPTGTQVPTDTPTETLTPTLTETATATDTPTETPTGTQVPTDTPTETPTETPLPPTETATETLTPTLTETATETPITNQPPVIAPILPQSMTVGETIIVVLSVFDPDGNPVIITDVSADVVGVVSLSFDSPTMSITITGDSAGSANITATVADDQGATGSATFTVTVLEAPTATATETETSTPVPNQPPSVFTPDQTVEVGQTITVTPSISDPENGVVTITDVVAVPDGIVSAAPDGFGNISVTGLVAGLASVQVTVTDDQGATGTGIFTVTVTELPTATPTETPIPTETPTETPTPTETATETPIPNQPPSVSVLDQTLEVGQTITVTPTISDPENGLVNITNVIATPDGIIAASPDGFGNISITGFTAGSASVTVTVADDQGAEGSATFTVTVTELPTATPTETATPIPNQPPTVSVPDQTVQVGQTITASPTISDPEGGFITITNVVASPDGIAAVAPDGSGNISITGLVVGSTSVTVTVADDQGAEGSTVFNVTVTELPTPTPTETTIPIQNQPPTVSVSDQTVDVGQTIIASPIISDPEGGFITLTNVVASPDGIVAVAPDGSGNISITGLAAGSASVTVTVADDQGAEGSTTFTVTVNAAPLPTDTPTPAGIDLTTVPAIPQFSGSMLQTIQNIYGSMQSNVFIVAGDVPPSAVLADAGDGTYDLSGAPELQTTLDVYLNQPLDSGNVLTDGGNRSTNANWRTADLLDPANNAADCGTATSPLDCALDLQQASVVIVMTGRNDVLAGTSLSQFQTDLQAVVDEIITSGAIPVLMTLPGNAAVDPYNQVIAQVAQANDIPLWNLWVVIPVDQVNGDLSLTSPGQNDQITAANMAAFGTIKRNEQLLRLLQEMRAAVPIQ